MSESTPVFLTYRDDVALLNLGDNENRLHPDWIAAVMAALDEAEQGQATALVTFGEGKFYNNGLHLKWLLANGDKAGWYVSQVQGLFSRILTFPTPTVAALNGHAFGAGALVAIAHDYRIMREDRGFFCFPEADIRIPFTPGMAAMIQAKLPPQSQTASMITGRRFPAPEAATHAIVDAVAAEADLIERAVELASAYKGKDKPTLRAIKDEMYRHAVEKLAEESKATVPGLS